MTMPDTTHTPRSPARLTAGAVLPGIGACLVVAAAATLVSESQRVLFGRVWLEPLVLAILLGAVARLAWTPSVRWTPGVEFSARTLLEVAIVLLGASVSGATLSSLGLEAIAVIFGLVALGIAAGYLIGRALGLNGRMALLIACGNAICGNSAIAAVAPVIDADGEDVAASIAFTAVLGILVVLCVPLLAAGLGLSATEYGFLAGLTVYAVPQVLAATASAGALATQTGAMVKLMRVLMLGPVVVALSLSGRVGARNTAPAWGRLLPWFIVGFLGMMGLRLCGVLPAPMLPILAKVSSLLTVLAMAGLGLQTQILAVARAGARTIAAVVLSFAALLAMALLVVWLL